MRKESSTLQKCKRQMATLGFDSQLAYHRVKLILKIYRDVVWVLSERVEELHEYAWELGAQDADTGLIYLQSFAPDMDLQEFEERVCCVMENRMLVDVIDRALLRLKRYPDRGELYYEILTKQFIHRFNSTEKELLDELNSEDLMKGWSVKWLKESIAYTEVRIRKAFSCRRTPATILQRKKAGTLLARSRRSACPAIKSALMTLLS